MRFAVFVAALLSAFSPYSAWSQMRGDFDLATLDEVRTIPLVVNDSGTKTGMQFEWRARDSSLGLWGVRWFIAFFPALAFVVFVSPELDIKDYWANNLLIWGGFSRLLKVPWVLVERVFLQRWQKGLDAQTREDLSSYRKEIRALLYGPPPLVYVDETGTWVDALPLSLELTRAPGQERPELGVRVQYGYSSSHSPEDFSHLAWKTVPIDQLKPKHSVLRTCGRLLLRLLF